MCESYLITTLIYAKFVAHDPNSPTNLSINVICISHLLTKDDKLLLRIRFNLCLNLSNYTIFVFAKNRVTLSCPYCNINKQDSCDLAT